MQARQTLPATSGAPGLEAPRLHRLRDFVLDVAALLSQTKDETRILGAGKATSYGVELETDTRLTERFGFQFSVGYLNANYDEYKGAGGPGVDADGHRLIGAPRWSVSGGLTYDVPVNIPGSLRLGVDAQFQSSIYSSALERPQDRAPGQTFVNGTLTWTSPDPRWAVVLSGRNLFDSEKPVSAGYTPSTGIYYQNFPDPRTFLVTLRFRG